MSDPVRVLVVDDSAYVRKVVAQMLGRSPFIEVVGSAREGEEALEMAAELDPDVITCDLNMPVVDGVAFVRAQMARRPVPIVVISIAAGAGEQVLAARAAAGGRGPRPPDVNPASCAPRRSRRRGHRRDRYLDRRAAGAEVDHPAA